MSLVSNWLKTSLQGAERSTRTEPSLALLKDTDGLRRQHRKDDNDDDDDDETTMTMMETMIMMTRMMRTMSMTTK